MAKRLSRCGNRPEPLGNFPRKSAVPVAPLTIGERGEAKGRNRGTRVYGPARNRKLTDEQAAEIRYRVGSGKISGRKAALEYDISQKTVLGLMAGKFYAKPSATAPRFELVQIQPLSESQNGRSYSLAPRRETKSA